MENFFDISEQDSESTSPSDSNGQTKDPKKSCCSRCFSSYKKCKFHNIIVFLILLSLLGLLTQMIQGGYMSAIMIDLQTHFNLSTSKIGLILSSYDIMGIFATPFLSFVGSKYNKCRVLGACGIVYAIGLVIFSLPYFVTDQYKITSFNYSNSNKNMTVDNIDYCKIPIQESSSNYSNSSLIQKKDSILENKECTRDQSNNLPYVIFIISQMVMSFGAAPLFPLGITFLSDNLDESLHALFTGN